jgi:hypothetical protein
MGQGRARAGRGGQGGGDAGHDRALDAGRAAGGQLLAAAAEQERVAALQAHDGQAVQGQGDQQLVDVVLRQGVARLALGDVDPPRRDGRQVEDLVGDQAVMHDHVGGLQGLQRLDRQQFGIAGTGAHQGHAARRADARPAAEGDEAGGLPGSGSDRGPSHAIQVLYKLTPSTKRRAGHLAKPVSAKALRGEP